MTPATTLRIALAALCAGPACAAGVPSSEEERAPPAMLATVTPQDDGTFRAVLRFDEKSPLWIFRRSAVSRDDRKSWRAKSWSILTPGVELRRIGNHEALVPTAPAMPREVAIRVVPYSGNLLADYEPALVLTDGTLALFSDHFTMRPAPSIAAIEALGASFNALPDYAGGNPRVIFEAAGRIMREDGRKVGQAKLDEPDYVVYGPAEPLVTDDISTLIDPGLPPWLRRQLRSEVPALLDLYSDRLGERSGSRPQLIVGWAGPTVGVVSLGGSVIGDTVIMSIEGDRLMRPSREALAYARQFIAHESAHFWLGNTVGYGDPGDAWTTEGGSDLIAQRAAAMIDPAHDARPAIEKSINDCIAMAGDGPLKSAPERNGQNAFYACGLTFSLVAERSADGDFFGFWRRLIDANRKDGVVSVDDWLEALRREGASRQTIALIAAMHENGVPDARASIRALLESAQIALRVDADGRLRLA